MLVVVAVLLLMMVLLLLLFVGAAACAPFSCAARPCGRQMDNELITRNVQAVDSLLKYRISLCIFKIINVSSLLVR